MRLKQKKKKKEREREFVRIGLVDLWCSWILGQLGLQKREREDNREKETERLH